MTVTVICKIHVYGFSWITFLNNLKLEYSRFEAFCPSN